eukprot:scaffold18271_cov71-Phaeocystis_antarctica.AAC.6
MRSAEGEDVAQLELEPGAVDADRRRRCAIRLGPRAADGHLNSLTCLLTNLGRLIFLVRLAAVVPALAIPTRAARARARVGDARIIAGDPHLGLEEVCSEAATLCAQGLQPYVLANCNLRYRAAADLGLEEVCGVQHGPSAADEQ